MKTKSPSQSAFLNLRLLVGVVLFLCGVGLAVAGLPTRCVVPIEAIGSRPNAPATDAIQYSPADKEGRFVYLIEFAEKGMLHRQTLAHGERFNANTPQAKANRDQVVTEHANHVQAMTGALGRDLKVTHYFLVTHSGIATRLTPEEAQALRGLPGIKSVERERLNPVTTFSSPKFIGADKIWDGSAVPPGSSGTKGAGIIIAMLDTGIDPAHPSFANDPACGHGTTEPNKLISALDCSSTDPNGLCDGPNPVDTVDHGTHTASTAGGNTVTTTANPPPFLPISGVAPCASIRAYKVCPGLTCPDADIEAGIDSVLIHGDASVLNFSISGGTSPWNDNDRDFLDVVDSDVLVSASAGNGDTVVGQVNHRGPWMLTVAASTKDKVLFDGVVSASGPGQPPPETQNIGLSIGSASPDGTVLNDFPIRHYTGQNIDFEGCSSEPAFPPGFFNGSVALIRRGNCPFTEKITNAFNAGAAMVVIRNNVAGTVLMDTTGQPSVPAYSCDQIPGDALAAFVDANPTSATADFTLARISRCSARHFGGFQLARSRPGAIPGHHQARYHGPRCPRLCRVSS